MAKSQNQDEGRVRVCRIAPGSNHKKVWNERSVQPPTRPGNPSSDENNRFRAEWRSLESEESERE